MRINIAHRVIRLSFSPWLQLMALLALTALALVSLIPAELSPPRTRLPSPIEHFIAYAGVSVLVAFAFQRSIRTWVLACALIGYAGVLEYSQRWSPGRSASVLDFLGGSAGALFGIAVCLLVVHGLVKLDEVVARR